MCPKGVPNISWQERVINTEIRQQTGQALNTDLRKRRRWTYLSRILRMTEDRLLKAVYEGYPQERCKRGKPKHTQRRLYNRDISSVELSLQPRWEGVTVAAQLPDVWWRFVDALCAIPSSGGKIRYLISKKTITSLEGPNSHFGVKNHKDTKKS